MTNRDEKQSQSERFKRAAEEAGVELDEEQLKRALRKMKETPAEKEDDDAEGR